MLPCLLRCRALMECCVVLVALREHGLRRLGPLAQVRTTPMLPRTSGTRRVRPCYSAARGVMLF